MTCNLTSVSWEIILLKLDFNFNSITLAILIFSEGSKICFKIEFVSLFSPRYS